ncbi:MAG TPA: MBL fold metallo-hydrolase [Gaiellaceae bacterium]|nr:MBL fold metallo-hydrolase [Gaiellaceae bacterium]
MQEIAPRLWHWTAPHPEWEPKFAENGGWEEIVSSYALVAGDALVLFDPLVPADEPDPLWAALDRDVAAHGPPAILITVYWHARDAQVIADRYEGATVWAHEPAAALVGERVRHTDTFTEDDELPGGAQAIPLHNRDEVAYWLPSHKATVIGDTILGGDGRARLCPPSWLGEQDSMDDVRAAVHRILKFPANRLLLTHGGPTDSANLEV